MSLSRKRTKKLALQIVLIVVAVYVVYGVLLYAFQRSLLFPGMSIHVPQSPPVHEGVQVLELEAGELRVEAWFAASRTSDPRNSPTVIFAHGNYETIDSALEGIERYTEIGCNLLMVEYPGYGRCNGSPSEENIAAAFAAGYDWITSSGLGTEETIIAHGRSVGGGAVCALSRKRELAGLILQSTFTNITSFAGRYFMPGFLVRDTFDNLERIQSFSNPVLLIHGRHDELVPYQHAEHLHAAAAHSTLVAFDCGHNDCPDEEARYWEEIERFVDSIRRK